MSVPFIELFCGIGGFAYAIGPPCNVAAAFDINRNALAIYRKNFQHPTTCKSIESLTAESTTDWSDKSWWMSPPCQPFTRRGKQLDAEDPRSKAFLNVLRLLEAHRPPELAMENVPGFENSECHSRLIQLLKRLGYHVQHRTICQTEFGFQNRRRRFYLLAAKSDVISWRAIELQQPVSVHEKTEESHSCLSLDVGTMSNYAKAIDIVDSDSQTSCFTSAYGRSPVRSGSFLQTELGVRHFSPREILGQLGFENDFALPDWSNEKLWPLVGNSLSIPSVRYAIAHLPSVHSRRQAKSQHA